MCSNGVVCQGLRGIQRQRLGFVQRIHQRRFKLQRRCNAVLDVGLLQFRLLDRNVARQTRELVVVLAARILQLPGKYARRQWEPKCFCTTDHLLFTRQGNLRFPVTRSVPNALFHCRRQPSATLNARVELGLQVVEKLRGVCGAGRIGKRRGLQDGQLGNLVQLVQPILMQVDACESMGLQRQELRRRGQGHVRRVGDRHVTHRWKRRNLPDVHRGRHTEIERRNRNVEVVNLHIVQRRRESTRLATRLCVRRRRQRGQVRDRRQVRRGQALPLHADLRRAVDCAVERLRCGTETRRCRIGQLYGLGVLVVDDDDCWIGDGHGQTLRVLDWAVSTSTRSSVKACPPGVERPKPR